MSLVVDVVGLFEEYKTSEAPRICIEALANAVNEKYLPASAEGKACVTMTTLKVTSATVLGKDWLLSSKVFELTMPLTASPGLSDAVLDDALQLRVLLGKTGKDPRPVGKISPHLIQVVVAAPGPSVTYAFEVSGCDGARALVYNALQCSAAATHRWSTLTGAIVIWHASDSVGLAPLQLIYSIAAPSSPPGHSRLLTPKLSLLPPPPHSLRIGAQQGYVYASRSIGSPER